LEINGNALSDIGVDAIKGDDDDDDDGDNHDDDDDNDDEL